MRRVLTACAALLGLALAAHALSFCYGLEGRALFDGDPSARRAIGDGARQWSDARLASHDFSTGSARFDGEWRFGSRMMASVGFAQVSIEDPALAPRYRAALERSLDGMLAPDARAFDRDAWGVDPLDDLGSPRAHVAYLGYASVALALAEHAGGGRPETLDAFIAHLVPLLEASPTGLLETYPGEVYPVDNASVLAALALYDRARGADHGALIERVAGVLETRYRDSGTGLLVQAVHPTTGAPVDHPRGSGTALAAFYLAFADRERSLRLYEAMRAELLRTTCGFGTAREYASGGGGLGDIDSGPIVLGQGVSATGFTLALARIHDDRSTFVAHWATAAAVGGPVDRGGTQFALGGPLGDALLFAMATALPADHPVMGGAS